MTTTLKVKTKNLELDRYNLKFEYIVFWNNKVRAKGIYDESHNMEPELMEEFEKDLKKQGMVMLALEQVR